MFMQVSFVLNFMNGLLLLLSSLLATMLGLAILNPSAQQQVRQYASSVTELFKLIIQEKKEELKARLEQVPLISY